MQRGAWPQSLHQQGMDAVAMGGWSVSSRPPAISAENLAGVFALLQSQGKSSVCTEQALRKNRVHLN